MAFPYSDLDVIVRAYMGADPTADPGTWPSATDLSARLLNEPIISTRGRQPGQRTLSAGSCTFTLHNEAYGDGLDEKAAGVLTPELAISPFYDQWDVGTPVQLLVDNVGASPPYSQFCGFVANVETVVVPGVGGVMHSAVKVTLGGVVMQRSQGTRAISGLRRTIMGSSPAAYWAFAGGTLTQAFAPTAGSGSTISIAPTTPTVGGGFVEPGAEVASWLESGLRMFVEDSGDEAVIVGDLLGGLSASPTRLVCDLGFMLTQTGFVAAYLSTDSRTDYTNWSFGAGSSSNQVGVTALVAGSLVDTATVSQTVTHDVPHHVRLDLSQNGASVDLIAYYDGTAVITDTFAGVTLAEYRNIIVTTFGAATADAVVFLAAVWEGTPADVGNVAWAVTSGYAGEPAADRIARVCAEEGIPCTVT